jgi:hypothetical protein
MVVDSPCLTPSLSTDTSPQSASASFISQNVDFLSHHLTQCSIIHPRGLKGHEDDSNLQDSLSRVDMSGHRYPTQNATPHQVISVDACPAPRTISLLDLPPELVARILLYIPPLDIISCRRTCRMLHDLCGNSNLRYLVQMERSGVSDDMSSGLSYPERLRMLEKREEAWATLNFHRSVNAPIPFNRPKIWPVTPTGGVLLFGTPLYCERYQSLVEHSYVTLPSLSDAQDQKFEWKRHNFGTEVLQIKLAVHEHDMIVALTA